MQRHPVDLALPAWPVPEGAAVAGRHDVLRSTARHVHTAAASVGWAHCAQQQPCQDLPLPLTLPLTPALSMSGLLSDSQRVTTN